MPRKISRRGFLKTAAAGVAFPMIVPGTALGLNGRPSASERITVASIGVGPQGSGDMGNFLTRPDAQVVAVCDVKKWQREAGAKKVDEYYGAPGCAQYSDFRELLARDDIDAVSIATPDHWHVLVAMAAAQAGKHIYLEKPMGLSVAEDQALRAAVHQYGVKFQFGTQQRSNDRFWQACQLAINGYVGELNEINVWSPASVGGGPLTLAPVPDGLDYDMWIGPAPMVPHSIDRCENALWWFNTDYAIGFIAGWGIHPLDIAWWGAGEAVSGPVEVSGTGEFPSEGFCDTATNWDIKLKYKNSGVVMNYTGLPCPEKWTERYRDTSPSHGTAFEGTEGWIQVDRSHINVSNPSLLDVKFKPNDIMLTQSEHHAGNLIECIKNGNETVCPIDGAVQADILCHITDIAIRLKRPITWDPATEKFINDDEANRRLSRSMRSPWRV